MTLLHFQSVDPARLKTALSTLEESAYDLESWHLVIKDAQTKKIDDARDTFEKIVTLFPTSGRFWKVYIEQEVLKQGSFIRSLCIRVIDRR